MKVITKDDLLEYFEHINNVAQGSPCEDQDHGAFKDAIEEYGYQEPLVMLFAEAFLKGGGRYGACASLWATGFQMGREFEIRRGQLSALDKLLKSPEPS